MNRMKTKLEKTGLIGQDQIQRIAFTKYVKAKGIGTQNHPGANLSMISVSRVETTQIIQSLFVPLVVWSMIRSFNRHKYTSPRLDFREFFM